MSFSLKHAVPNSRIEIKVSVLEKGKTDQHHVEDPASSEDESLPASPENRKEEEKVHIPQDERKEETKTEAKEVAHHVPAYADIVDYEAIGYANAFINLPPKPEGEHLV